jgi:hypothetical protein
MDSDVFRGQVLNQPHHLQSVRQGSDIQFVAADGAEFPVMVTEKYLGERDAWVIHPCRTYGFSELFDAPSDLLQAVFPHAPPDARTTMFTAICPLCGGVQGVESRTASVSPDEEAAGESPPANRP